MTTATEITAALPKATKAFARIEPLDWQEIGKNLDEQGNAVLAGVLTLQECKALASLYPNEDGFRSRVVMGRYGFGRGEYKYFSYPLPDIIEDIRTELYSRLAPLANKWNESMKIDVRYPAKHAQFINAVTTPASVSGRSTHVNALLENWSAMLWPSGMPGARSTPKPRPSIKDCSHRRALNA
ncbi:MAG TPA: 2OG-Fe(II) oxygenase [Terriglobia bacterium]|nr:2OG-Fe(II) oxygenase [Terriglobia bacterium]